MYTHGPSCLEGPVSRKRRGWKRAARREEGAPVRVNLVERVRKEIAAGTYDTPAKLDAALERLQQSLEAE